MANKKAQSPQKNIQIKNIQIKNQKNSQKKSGRVAIYPGSFDPITFGHIDIIERISTQFESVIILLSHASEKKYLFNTEERQNFVRRALKDFPNVRVEIAEGLTVNDCRRLHSNTIVRGLRAVVDFEYEMTMANMNKKLAPEIETILIFASPDYYYVSSRGVKEVARYGGSLEHFVPEFVAQQLRERLRE